MITRMIKRWQVLNKGAVMGTVFAMSYDEACVQATTQYKVWDTLIPL